MTQIFLCVNTIRKQASINPLQEVFTTAPVFYASGFCNLNINDRYSFSHPSNHFAVFLIVNIVSKRLPDCTSPCSRYWSRKKRRLKNRAKVDDLAKNAPKKNEKRRNSLAFTMCVLLKVSVSILNRCFMLSSTKFKVKEIETRVIGRIKKTS